MAARPLTIAEARTFYDRWGAKQDTQAFYEDAAVEALVRYADFREAEAVLEFGCGTGRLAERLLSTLLAPACRYVGLDVSSTMVALARARLARWHGRAEAVQSDGSTDLRWPEGAFDRFVSTYVLDLLGEAQTQALLREAHRALRPGGLCGLVSLTHGRSPYARLVSSVWTAVHMIRPGLVGGCRPVELLPYLSASCWRVRHCEVVCAWGISSEVLVAARLP